MSIRFDPVRKTLTLNTRNTTYQMLLTAAGHLLHLYYGRRAEGCFDYLLYPRDCGFSPNPYEKRSDRSYSLDTLPQEYSGCCNGDYRLSAVIPVTESGAHGAELRYVRHTVVPGKYALDGLPSAFAREGEAETLSVVLADPAAGLEVELLYGVYEAQDVITRAARLKNVGGAPLRLEKAASLCLDLPAGRWDLLHFHGRHTMERQPERRELICGIESVESLRGMSGHQHNPFVILCAHDATEDAGECIGVMPVYSGNHRTEIETDQMGSVRVVSGIHDGLFSWTLSPGETFDVPEVLLSFSGEGLTPLSQTYHRFLRRNLCRSRFSEARRPVLLNSWEAAYFDFDEEKLLELARGAKELGVDMLVLDDGWFGSRDDDNRGLGDWFENRRKLPGGLEGLIGRVNALGLQFGLWIEPEMVSEDSELYRAHPDWAMTVPGRPPVMGRSQLMLDLSRAEIVDYLYGVISGLLRRCNIAYIKWDMNRGLADVYSRALPPERQGEVSHRYVLGLYRLMDRLTADFPDVLFEGCAGGGGRFDAGILAYFPQIWCSDNTDAVARLAIQRGTSFGYPLSSMASHVSAVPNHQTGRSTPLGTRGIVAMGGAFGYELAPASLSAEEKEEIREQIERYRAYEPLLRAGDYYRLASDGRFTAWMVVSPEKDAALLSMVTTAPESNPRPFRLRLKGLDPEAAYTAERKEFAGCVTPPEDRSLAGADSGPLSGAALMYGGYALPALFGDFPGVQVLFRRTDR